MNDKLLQEFRSPSCVNRAKPFWAWNGKLEPEELRRQIRIFKQMGLGGFFMHSRVGLDTAYLSKEWFDCVRTCIDEARKQDMEAWLYDEDRWPSGAAGGFVTKDERYRMRFLKMVRHTDAKTFRWTTRTQAAFVARIDGYVARDVAPVRRGSKPKLAPGQTLLAMEIVLAQPANWYNGYTYLDTLNPQAVRQFIKVTHEAYTREVGKDFGKLVPGIFTDEPCLSWPGEDQIPWTDRLPVVFQRQYGYDLVDRVMELFFDVEGQTLSQVKWHFFDCVTELFVQSFAKPIFDWCEREGIAFTGHVMGEDTLLGQSGWVGAPMRFYEYMQAPGMDLLTERWRAYLTAKQVASAARQFGRKWRLTETNGCTGWDFPFEAHKALGDWQAAVGINLRCPHLSWYTMLGEAKRDYPASIFYQSPWWQQYEALETYYGRINAVMTRGSEVRDLLVIHPIESAWCMWRPAMKFSEEGLAFERAFDADLRKLLSAGLDFDLGDEALLAKMGKVKPTGKASAASGRGASRGVNATLTVGKARYKAVLVPAMKTIRSSTLALLQRFREAGGLVVFAGELPAAVDAVPSEAAMRFAQSGPRFAALGEQAVAAIAPVARRVEIVDAASGKQIPTALYLLREDKDATYLFVCNTSHVPEKWDDDCLVRDRREAFGQVEIRVQLTDADAKALPVELDPATGETFAAEAEFHGLWQLRTSLPRIGSRLFVFPRKASKAQPPRRPARRVLSSTPLNPSSWDVVLDEDNVLVLDRLRFRVGKGQWQEAREVLRADRAIRDAIGIPHRGGDMIQPWAQDKSAKHKTTTVAMEYEFEVRALPAGPVRLAIEKPSLYRIALNGQAINSDAATGWWTDRSLETLPIGGSLLRLGRNTVTLETQYSQQHPGLEIMYLLGSFGAVAEGNAGAIVAPPTQLRLGDWTTQGLAFYGGNVGYRTQVDPVLEPGKRLVIRLGELRGVAARVLVAGKPAGLIAWEPLELDITDALAEVATWHVGPIDLTIEVLGHRRNCHGPLHHTMKWPHWTGPGEFVSQGEFWSEAYNLVPCGLMSPPELLVMG